MPDDEKISFLVLLASPDSPQYRALYRWARSGSCVKVHGSRLAPTDISGVIEQAMVESSDGPAAGVVARPSQRWNVNATWKYVSGPRNFVLLPTCAPGLTTDAISIVQVK